MDINEMRETVERLNDTSKFQVGDVVRWKEGMKNRKKPEYGEIAVVSRVLDSPIYSTEGTGTQYFGEPLDLVLARYANDDFVEFHYDSRRFERCPVSVDGKGEDSGLRYKVGDRVVLRQIREAGAEHRHPISSLATVDIIDSTDDDQPYKVLIEGPHKVFGHTFSSGEPWWVGDEDIDHEATSKLDKTTPAQPVNTATEDLADRIGKAIRDLSERKRSLRFKIGDIVEIREESGLMTKGILADIDASDEETPYKVIYVDEDGETVDDLWFCEEEIKKIL